MKVALYIEELVTQLVLTPETAAEKAILAIVREYKDGMELKYGTFYPTVGGWIRQYEHEQSESTMIVLRHKS